MKFCLSENYQNSCSSIHGKYVTSYELRRKALILIPSAGDTLPPRRSSRFQMAQEQICTGYLIPLDENFKEDPSKKKLPIYRGPNVIGRNSAAVPDKRVSRKHVTLNSSDDGSAILSVEGTNPVVVHTKNERKKLCSSENATISDGDFVELIPGHYFFKYAVMTGSEVLGRKRLLQVSECEDYARKSKKFEVGYDGGGQRSSVEAIRNFRVPENLLPMTFRLLSVKGLPPWANTGSVSINDVIEGDVQLVVLSNYMVDIDWLIPACPALEKAPHVLVIHGEGDGTLDHMKRNKPANWILHKPPLPIAFGTHHSKAMLLVYPRGIRIVVHTANLIYVDWNNKSQGLWMQDFPWKDKTSSSKDCEFENDLIDYLKALKWPEFTVKLRSLESFTINPSFFKKFDYGNAAVRLIASVPGYHTGANINKWGHLKLRSVLKNCTFDKEFRNSPLVYQFSSLGSLDEKWMSELASSMSSGSTEDGIPIGLGEPLIVWPTVEDVRCSLEGYAAGNAVPSPLKNVEKKFLGKYWAKWKATHSGRSRAMPHIKTFARYRGQNLAWLLLTSSNLSKAAWGALQKNNSQIMIRSYELGVLFLPSKRQVSGFSCTRSCISAEDELQSLDDPETDTLKLVTLNWEENKNDASSPEQAIRLPLPYELPPQPYAPEDVPWSWDRRYSKRDVCGHVWPRHVQLYASQGS